MFSNSYFLLVVQFFAFTDRIPPPPPPKTKQKHLDLSIYRSIMYVISVIISFVATKRSRTASAGNAETSSSTACLVSIL